MKMRIALALGLLLLNCGCLLGRYHYYREPIKNMAIAVKSGEHWKFELDEHATAGYQWQAESDDDCVEVEITREAKNSGRCGESAKAVACVKILRGFDGPSTVTLTEVRPWSQEVARTVAIQLYFKTGDTAIWK